MSIQVTLCIGGPLTGLLISWDDIIGVVAAIGCAACLRELHRAAKLRRSNDQ